MLDLFCIIFILVYGYFYIYSRHWPEKKLETRPAKALKITHFIALGITILIIFMGSHGWRLRGIWTNTVFIYYAIISGILYPFLAGLHSTRWGEKIYFKVFSTIPLLLAGIFMITFIGAILLLTLIGYSMPSDTILYNDNDYRIQESFGGVLGAPFVEVYEKSLLTEHTVSYHTEPLQLHLGPRSIDSLHRIEDAAPTRFLIFPDTSEVKYYLVVSNE